MSQYPDRERAETVAMPASIMFTVWIRKEESNPFLCQHFWTELCFFMCKREQKKDVICVTIYIQIRLQTAATLVVYVASSLIWLQFFLPYLSFVCSICSSYLCFCAPPFHMYTMSKTTAAAWGQQNRMSSAMRKHKDQQYLSQDRNYNSELAKIVFL